MDRFHLTIVTSYRECNQMCTCLWHQEDLWWAGIVLSYHKHEDPKVDWDDIVPQQVHEAWLQWRIELNLFADRHTPRCYFPTFHHMDSLTHQSMPMQAWFIMSPRWPPRPRLASPIKRLTIPCLELCGAHLLAQLLQAFHLTMCTHEPVVCWLNGNSWRVKTYVGNSSLQKDRILWMELRIQPTGVYSHLSY